MLIPANSVEHNNGFIGGFYIRCFGPYEKGAAADGHAHWIDHMMFVEAGAVRVDWKAPDGRAGSVEIEAVNFVTIKAEAEHRIEALEDGTKWRCMFAAAEAEKLVDDQGPIPYMMGRGDGRTSNLD